MEKVITESNYDEIVSGTGVTLIDFWAVWCGPCRMLAPIVAEISNEYEGRAVVAKCNVDDCENLTARFGIRNIPTLIFLKNGEVADRTVGVVSRTEIEERLEKLI